MEKPSPDSLLNKLYENSSKFIYLLDAFQIPNQHDYEACSDYLLSDNIPRQLSHEDTEEEAVMGQKIRLEVMENKIRSKYLNRKPKHPVDCKASRRRILNKNSFKKSLRKIQMVEKRTSNLDIQRESSNKLESQTKSKQRTFNTDGKIMFPKFVLDENDTPRKGVDTDTKKLFRKAVNNKKNLHNLKDSGDNKAYAEVKLKSAWEKAIAKTVGQKVRDDPALLSKQIQKRKKQISKSKEEWAERKQKLEHKKDMKQKKRMENIKERSEKKKNKKIKNLAKKGRIIAGF